MTGQARNEEEEEVSRKDIDEVGNTYPDLYG